MIDLHCHILPGIDDGPETMDEALELARMVVARGITHSVVTPHIQPGTWDNDRRIIQKTYEQFREALAQAGIDLKLGMAAEVRVCGEIMPLFMQEQLPFLGEWEGSRVMLLELPHGGIPVGTDKLVQWLIQRDVLPMIAHPERNKAIMRDLDKIEPFVDMGCLFQVTAGSLAGQFGGQAQDRAQAIIEEGWATILASDAHNRQHRPPNLDEGRAAAVRFLGEEVAQELVYDAPLKLVSRVFA